MEFTDNLKGKLEEAKNEEEVKNILEETKKKVKDAGIVLDDTELNKVAGGCAIFKARERKSID